jgi:hypothetical protein
MLRQGQSAGEFLSKVGDWLTKIKLHISDAIAAQRETEGRVDPAIPVA